MTREELRAQTEATLSANNIRRGNGGKFRNTAYNAAMSVIRQEFPGDSNRERLQRRSVAIEYVGGER